MVSVNPFVEFRVACEKVLGNALKKLFPEVAVSFVFEVPPSFEFG